METTKIVIFCDGGARGNPGPAGVGVVIRQLDKETKRPIEISKFIGTATNNQAEYRAVIEALKWIKEKYPSNRPTLVPGTRGKVEDLEIECFLDSQLIVEQLNLRYKIKNEGLKPLFNQVRELIMSLDGKVTFAHILREKNKEADKLVNQALDKEVIRQRDKKDKDKEGK